MSTFWENIFKFRQKKVHEIDKILLKIPIFHDLNHSELRQIKDILHQREYNKHEVIFNQSDVGLGMYIIEKGTVNIVAEPESQLLAKLSEGDFFGELALLDDAPRSASAVTETPCTMLCFFKPELLDLIDRNPKLGSKVLFRLAWTIGERLKTTNEQIKELSSLTQQDQIVKEK